MTRGALDTADRSRGRTRAHEWAWHLGACRREDSRCSGTGSASGASRVLFAPGRPAPAALGGLEEVNPVTVSDVLELQDMQLDNATDDTPLMCSGLSVSGCSVAQPL